MKKGLYLPEETVLKIRSLILQQVTDYRIARTVPCSEQSVRKVRAMMPDAPEPIRRAATPADETSRGRPVVKFISPPSVEKPVVDRRTQLENGILKNHARMFKYAMKLTGNDSQAQDIVSVAVLRAIRFADRWKEGANPVPWLLTIIRNVYVTEMRQRKRQRTDSLSPSDEAEIPGASDAASRLIVRDLVNALRQMPPEMVDVIRLITIEGMKYDEAAAALGIPEGTVRSRLSRGRSLLRSLMG